VIDSGAATLILQDWLSTNAPVPEFDDYDPDGEE
jgi:hypothetical protein